MRYTRDKDYRHMISTARWLRLRREQLEAQPLCEVCLKAGRYTSAREVHHRVPVETSRTLVGKTRLMFDPTNLQSVCHSCHVAIHKAMGKGTARENAKRKAEEGRGFITKLIAGGNDDGNADNPPDF